MGSLAQYFLSYFVLADDDNENIFSKIFGWIIDHVKMVLQEVFGFLTDYLLKYIEVIPYQIMVWIPLQLTAVMILVFRYFCGPFMPELFGFKFDASHPIGWQWSSQLGYYILVVFGLSFLWFGFTFILAFNKKSMVDEFGAPIKSNFQRLASFRWPGLMVIALLITPIFLSIADMIISTLTLAFSNEKPVPFTSQEIVNVKNILPTLLQDYKQINNDVTGTAMNNLINYINALEWQESSLQNLINEPEGTDLYLEYSKIAGDEWWKYHDILTRQLELLTSCQEYLKSGLDKDINALNDVLRNIKEGSFLTDEQGKTILSIKANVVNFTENWRQISNGWNEVSDYGLLSYKNTVIEISDLFQKGVGQGLFHTYRKISIVVYPDDIDPIFNTIYNSFTGAPGSNGLLKNLVNFENSDSDSYGLLYGRNGSLGLSQIYYKQNKMIAGNQLCQTLYCLATTDPNPENWDNHTYAAVNGYWANPFLWFAGAFAIFAFMRIVYTFCLVASKRIYFLLGYWVLGFAFLANGINKPGDVGSWYKKLFGQYVMIVAVYVMFMFASALATGEMIQTIRQQLDNEFQSTLLSGNIFGIAGRTGAIIMFEAIFTISYLAGTSWASQNGYAGSANIGYEHFNFMNEGASVLAKYEGNLKSYYKDVTQPGHETRATWRESFVEPQRALQKARFDSESARNKAVKQRFELEMFLNDKAKEGYNHSYLKAKMNKYTEGTDDYKKTIGKYKKIDNHVQIGHLIDSDPRLHQSLVNMEKIAADNKKWNDFERTSHEKGFTADEYLKNGYKKVQTTYRMENGSEEKKDVWVRPGHRLFINPDGSSVAVHPLMADEVTNKLKDNGVKIKQDRDTGFVKFDNKDIPKDVQVRYNPDEGDYTFEKNTPDASGRYKPSFENEKPQTNVNASAASGHAPNQPNHP